jgi:hypothetical protein
MIEILRSAKRSALRKKVGMIQVPMKTAIAG